MCGVIYSTTYICLVELGGRPLQSTTKRKKVKAAAFLWPFRGGSALLYFRIGKEREKRNKGKIIQIQFPPFSEAPAYTRIYFTFFANISLFFSLFKGESIYQRILSSELYFQQVECGLQVIESSSSHCIELNIHALST